MPSKKLMIVLKNKKINILVFDPVTNCNQITNGHRLVWATVPDRCLGPGSGSNRKCFQIGCPGSQYTGKVNLGPVRWKSSNLSELGRLAAGHPAGLSVESYNALVFAV